MRPGDGDSLAQESAINMRVENIRNFTCGMLVLECPILHFFCFSGVGIDGHEARDEWKVVEYFAWFLPAIAINKIMIFVAIWASHSIFVHRRKTAAQVNTAVISDWFET